MKKLLTYVALGILLISMHGNVLFAVEILEVLKEENTQTLQEETISQEEIDPYESFAVEGRDIVSVGDETILEEDVQLGLETETAMEEDVPGIEGEQTAEGIFSDQEQKDGGTGEKTQEQSTETSGEEKIPDTKDSSLRSEGQEFVQDDEEEIQAGEEQNIETPAEETQTEEPTGSQESQIPEETLSWTWKTESGKESCVSIKSKEKRTITVLWGEGEAETKDLSTVMTKVCHSYESEGEKEVTLKGTEILTHVDLSKQNVTSFAGGKATQLEVLYLQENVITTLQSHVFTLFQKLFYLDLSKNQLKGLEEGTLSSLSHLSQIGIYGNCITEDQIAESEKSFLEHKIPNWQSKQVVCEGKETETTEEKTNQEEELMTFVLEEEPEITLMDTGVNVDDMRWTWTPTSANRCFGAGKKSGMGNLMINWGDGSTGSVPINVYPSSVSSICHTYPMANTGYEVTIINPEVLTYLFLESKEISSFFGGNGLNLTTIYLGYNQIHSLAAGIFDGLPNLINLYVFNNPLNSLPVGIFDGLSNLKNLGLGATQLSSLPEGIFDGLSNLATLSLINNQFSELSTGSFEGLSSLTSLFLNKNQLNSLPVGIFDGLSNLTTLYLHENQLNNLPTGVFDGLSNLIKLNLSSNLLNNLPEGVFDGLSNLTTFNLSSNCLENSQIASGTYNWFNTEGWISQITLNQNICLGTVEYSPSTGTSGSVIATIPLYGDAAKKASLGSFSHTFMENGSYDFTIPSSSDLLNRPTSGKVTATVDWIDRRMGFRPFITTWKTDNPGTSNANTIKIPTNGAGYDFAIDWGDGIIQNISGTTPNTTHTYATPGTYQVKIKGKFPRIHFNNGGDKNKILTVNQWGDGERSTMNGAFYGCENLDGSATDAPNLSKVTDMNFIFAGAINFNGDLSAWDTSKVKTFWAAFLSAKKFNSDLSQWNMSSATTLRAMFESAESFNSDLSAWDVSNVTETWSLFHMAKNFTSDLSTWNVSKVTNMRGMFWGAENFNSDLSTWDVGKVTNMIGMFQDTKFFNSDLSNRNTSNVTTMIQMFYGAKSFNGDVNTWNTSNVTTMRSMFRNATSFNQDLSTWNTSKVTDMAYMFGVYGTTGVFNGDISTWDTSNVTTMRTMFQNQSFFNQDISSWNTSKVTDMAYMFLGNTKFNQPIENWDTSNVTNMQYMYGNTASFNQPIGNWNTSKVTTMYAMFYNAPKFNQPIGTWDTSNVTNMAWMFGMEDVMGSFNQSIGNWNTSKVIDMEGIFYKQKNFDQNLSSWDITKVENFGGTDGGVFDGAGLSTFNYNEILQGWSQQSVHTGLTFVATPAMYGGCNLSNREAGMSGRVELETTYGWTIIDGGLEDCKPVTPSGGGAGGKKLVEDDCPKGDYSPSYYDGTCGKKKDTHDAPDDENQGDEEKLTPPKEDPVEKSGYEKAFDWAYENVLTSMSNLERARMEDSITRAEAAKLISLFASEILEKETDTTKEACKEFNDLQGVNDELKGYITLSCELGIMGYYANGKDIKPNFDPYDTLTRAEFGTMLSRLLRGNLYAGDEKNRYYAHLQALKNEKIMTKINEPTLKETRGNVFLMLQRVAER